MHPARIRKLGKTASDLAKHNNYEAAFALRWIAYEGLIVRAAIKALWMRGASVKDAERIITTLNLFNVMKLLKQCCGNNFNIDSKGEYPILKTIKDRSELRHLLFHQLNVPSKRKLKQFSDLLALTLDQPEAAFGKIKVALDGSSSARELGDPLVDLRKLKRSSGITRKAVADLISVNLKQETTILDLTDDEQLLLFIPPPHPKT